MGPNPKLTHSRVKNFWTENLIKVFFVLISVMFEELWGYLLIEIRQLYYKLAIKNLDLKVKLQKVAICNTAIYVQIWKLYIVGLTLNMFANKCTL